jgi:hypothetical protein
MLNDILLAGNAISQSEEQGHSRGDMLLCILRSKFFLCLMNSGT